MSIESTETIVAIRRDRVLRQELEIQRLNIELFQARTHLGELVQDLDDAEKGKS